MNIFNQIKILPDFLMNSCSSVFLASDNFIANLLATDNLLTRLLRIVLQLIYFTCKWVMYMVDVIYFYIMQLAGISIDTSIFDSASSDTTFKLLIDNKDMVTTIIKNLIAIAIILIIVTAVIAIIRQQTMALKEKKAKKNPAGDVLKSIFKSVLLIILTPMIAILGIVASSVILQSLFNATNLSETKSLSSRVFNVSASSASRYRLYAENGVRIPIKYKFTDVNEDDVERANNAVTYAVEMIGNEKFPSMQYFDLNATFIGKEFQDPVLDDKKSVSNTYPSGVEEWRNTVYYSYFDSSEEYNAKASGADKHKIMHTHRNEYYAMADVISYALDSLESFYFVTIQELLESVASMPSGVREAQIKRFIEDYSIRVVKSNGDFVGMDADGTSVTDANEIISALESGGYSYITYDTTYSSGTYTYTHLKDAIDEMEGAKFVVAYKVVGEKIFTENINGNYYEGDSSKTAEKYFYRESEKDRYKKVDLYYYFNDHRGEYVKSPTYPVPSGDCYYKLGDEYYQVTPDKMDDFYFKDENGDYHSITLGQAFYNDIKTYYYHPLVEGLSVGENNSVFKTEYMEPARIITARGIFDETAYPTAMRRTTSGDIMFYRDDLELVANGSVSDFATMDQIEAEEEEEEQEESGGFFKKIGNAVKSGWNSVKKFVTGLFNPLKLVPDLKLDPSAMSTTYTNRTHSVHVLKEGKIHISYFFGDNLSSSLSSKLYGMKLHHLFEPMNINYVVLILGTAIFMKIMVTSVFGLINRSLNIFIMILIYPVACATIPLDDASGLGKSGAYAKWSNKYTNLLFSTYGLILGLNFVFLILPIIDKLTFFTPQDLENNTALARIASALYNPLLLLPFKISAIFKPNFVLICNFINWLLRILFEIVAFSLITSPKGKGGGGEDTYYSVIQTVVGTGPGALEDSPLDAVKKTAKAVAQGVNMVMFPHKTMKNMAEKAIEEGKKAVDFLPGSAIAKEGIGIYKSIDKQKKQEDSRKALLDALYQKAPKQEVEAKLKEYKDLHSVKK